MDTKGMFVVFDLDGTLCNIEHRIHHIRGDGRKGWPSFFAACVALAPKGAGIRYVVVDRPLDEKVRDGGWRNEVRHGKSGLPLIEMHAQRFRSQIKDILSGDGRSDIEVVDLRSYNEEKAA